MITNHRNSKYSRIEFLLSSFLIETSKVIFPSKNLMLFALTSEFGEKPYVIIFLLDNFDRIFWILGWSIHTQAKP